MISGIYRITFSLLGWTISGSFPALRKYVIAVAPHTSNWDFLVGLAGRSIMRLRNVKYLGKSQLFKPPFGWLFRRLGGYPVERSNSHDMVRQVVALFDNNPDFILAVAPEGTRRKVAKLKTGFYFIAKGAGVPIVPCGFDYQKKKIIVGPPLYPSTNIDSDLAVLYTFFRSIKGKDPSLGLD